MTSTVGVGRRDRARPPERQPAAVLCADIAGYSRLVGLDELDTFHRVKALRSEILEPLVAKHGGRVVDYAGDGALIAFGDVFDGAECALEIQRCLARHEPGVPVERRISLRLGLHFGEIIADGSWIYGDIVNIAARLEELSEPGGLCLSDTVYREIVDRIAIVADYGGEPPLRNIAHDVGVWFWPNSVRDGRSPFLLPPADRTSIAVLSFDDFGAARDDGLADGVAEDLTTALARQSWLFVVARTSAFALKGKGVDAREAGRRLGVRYLVEGSVRRAGERVRINVQLVSADDEAHLWAERFDSTVDDLLDLQDTIVESTLAAIEPGLIRAEGARACSIRPGNLGAHHLYLRAANLLGPALARPKSGVLDEACALLDQAIGLGVSYAPVLALRGYFEAKAVLFGMEPDMIAGRRRALDWVERALEVDPEEPMALGAYGFVSANAEGDLDRAAVCLERALALNPSSVLFWNFMGEVQMYRGEHDAACDCLFRSMRLNPLDQRTVTNAAYLAFAYLFKRQFEESARWAQRAVFLAPNPLSYRILAASLAESDRTDEARAITVELLKLQPSCCLERSRGSNYRRAEDIATYVDALRKAGVPEGATGELAPPA